jgi:hypothetical protein
MRGVTHKISMRAVIHRPVNNCSACKSLRLNVPRKLFSFYSQVSHFVRFTQDFCCSFLPDSPSSPQFFERTRVSLVSLHNVRGETLRDSSGQPENGRAQLVRPAPCNICKVAPRTFSRAAGHSGRQGINSRIPTARVAPGRLLRHLESCSRRRETADGWRKPSSWLSENPVYVSIAGGNAVTAKVLVATANQHGCHRLRETTSPQDPHSQWGNARGGGRREGTTPGKVWTTF